MSDNTQEKIIIPRAIITHTNQLFELAPDPKFGGTPRVKCCLIIPNSDKETITELNKAINSVIAKKWGDSKPKTLKGMIQDGNDLKKEHYKDTTVMWPVNFKPVKIIGPDKSVITDQSLLYSGCVVRALIVISPWSNDYGNGIRFYVRIVQKIENGEIIDTSSDDDDIEELFDIVQMKQDNNLLTEEDENLL